MGLFDKAKAYVTGGHCTVTIEKPALGYVGMPMTIKVKAVAKQDFECTGVYVDVGCTEVVTVRPDGAPADLVKVNSTYSHQFKIAESFTMKSGDSKEWTGMVTLPKECQPTYAGKLCKHGIQVQGRLDTKGNDPDSGWQDLRIGVMS